MHHLHDWRHRQEAAAKGKQGYEGRSRWKRKQGYEGRSRWFPSNGLTSDGLSPWKHKQGRTVSVESIAKVARSSRAIDLLWREGKGRRIKLWRNTGVRESSYFKCPVVILHLRYLEAPWFSSLMEYTFACDFWYVASGSDLFWIWKSFMAGKVDLGQLKGILGNTRKFLKRVWSKGF